MCSGGHMNKVIKMVQWYCKTYLAEASVYIQISCFQMCRSKTNNCAEYKISMHLNIYKKKNTNAVNE